MGIMLDQLLRNNLCHGYLKLLPIPCYIRQHILKCIVQEQRQETIK